MLLIVRRSGLPLRLRPAAGFYGVSGVAQTAAGSRSTSAAADPAVACNHRVALALIGCAFLRSFAPSACSPVCNIGVHPETCALNASGTIRWAAAYRIQVGGRSVCAAAPVMYFSDSCSAGRGALSSPCRVCCCRLLLAQRAELVDHRKQAVGWQNGSCDGGVSAASILLCLVYFGVDRASTVASSSRSGWTSMFGITRNSAMLLVFIAISGASGPRLFCDRVHP